MKHILICGAKGVGKSTLIRRLCMDANAPIYGYCTKMLSTADADGLFPIYIFILLGKRKRSAHTAALIL